MSWNRVNLASLPAQPWRNGGGVTRELVAWPDAGDWAWRMSVAEVEQDGPFSRFDGVERWFAVLSGQGVHLEIDGSERQLSPASDPFCFDGAAHVACSLAQGPTQDFNLMLRRGRATGRMRRLMGAQRRRLDRPLTLAVYGLRGTGRLAATGDEAEFSEGCLLWQRLEANTAIELDALEVLWMEIEA